MSQIEQLTRQLSHIVNSLVNLISQGNSGSLKPEESSKPKKSSELTYHEYLHKLLQGKQPLPAGPKKASYRLQQDLQILLELSNHNAISVKTFETIAANKRVFRTAESLRSRYDEHLSKINEKQMKNIVAWIEKEGLEGFLYFEDGELTLSKVDPKDQAESKRRARPVSLETETKKTGQKAVKKGSKLKSVPTNCRELNQVLRLYSKMVNQPVRLLLQKLDKLSGDLVALDIYIQTRDQRMLWTPEEDQILRKGGQDVKILRRYRGDAVTKRIAYLGLK